MTPTRRALFPLVLALLSLGACREPPPGPTTSDPDNPLEAAARDRGVVDATENSSLVGVFERQHDQGQDGLCVFDRDGETRFALSAAYGPTVRCTGAGRVESDGSTWLLQFDARPDCRIAVREEGGSLIFAGTVPGACDDLCPSRASLSGLAMPRISWSADDAHRFRMKNRQGTVTQPCAK